MIELLARQIVSMRAAIGSLQAQVDAMAATLEMCAASQAPAPAPACAHVHTDDEGSTLTVSRRRCLDCRALLVDGEVQA